MRVGRRTMLLAALLVGGCAGYPQQASHKPQEAVAAADNAAAGIAEPLIRAEVRRDAAAASARRIVDLRLTPEPTLYAKAIAEALAAQQGDIQEARHATEQVRADLSAASAEAGKSASAYAKLRGQWYVAWGLRIEHGWIASKWIVGIAAVLFVAGGIAKDTGLAATGWGAAMVIAYRVILSCLTCLSYPLILLGRYLVSLKWPAVKVGGGGQ